MSGSPTESGSCEPDLKLPSHPELRAFSRSLDGNNNNYNVNGRTTTFPRGLGRGLVRTDLKVKPRAIALLRDCI